MKILIFNAPPGAGKDQCVQFAQEIIPDSLHFSFKRKLVELTQSIYNIPKSTWDSWYTREGKEIVRKELQGLSCRQALIRVSEEVIKPAFGKDYFGRQEADSLASALPKDYKIAVCSDGGFSEETKPLIDKFGIENMNVVYIFRDGCSFSNDSRSYLPNSLFLKKNTFAIDNNGSLDDLKAKVKKIIIQIV